MLRIPRGRLALATCFLFVALFGCGKEKPTGPTLGTAVPDFSLTDVNPNSATSGQQVSPRQSLATISAWYFGHAT